MSARLIRLIWCVLMAGSLVAQADEDTRAPASGPGGRPTGIEELLGACFRRVPSDAT